MKLAWAFGILFLPVLIGCQSSEENNPIYVRVKNASFWNYDSVKIGFNHTFSGLDTGALTLYQRFEGGNRPSSITFYSGTHQMVVDTGDIFQKNHLDQGKFTYAMY